MSVEIHPTALVGEQVELGEGCKIGPFVVVESDVVLGEGNEIGAGCYLFGGLRMGGGNRVMRSTSLGGEPQHLDYAGQPTRLIIGDDNWFGENLTIHRGSHVTGETVIGSNNYLMAATHVGHDSRLGDRIIMANDAKLGGHVTVSDGANFGAGAGVHQFARVGELVMVGALARVIRDVVPFTIVGSNEDLYGLNRVGLRRSDYPRGGTEALKSAYRMLCVKRRPIKEVIEWISSQPADPFLEVWSAFLSEKSIRGYARAARTVVKKVKRGEEKEESGDKAG